MTVPDLRTAPKPEATAVAAGALRAVVAEDDEVIRFYLQRLLPKLGYTVVGVVESAGDLRRAAASLRPDVCIVDVNLAGGSSGAEAAGVIRVEHGIPVLLVSAATEPPGALPFLRKPFTRDQLAASLERVLASRSSLEI